MKTLYLSIIVISLISGIIIITSTNLVFACSCVSASPASLAEMADAVFMGRVIKVDTYQNRVLGAIFEVQKAWKGVSTKQIHVGTMPMTDCNYEFVVNQTYVVYASGKEGLYTNTCSGTKLLEDAYEDLRSLGLGTVPTKDSEPECLGGRYCPEHMQSIREKEDFQNMILMSAIGIPLVGGVAGFVIWNNRKNSYLRGSKNTTMMVP